jgi:hypothetical protein
MIFTIGRNPSSFDHSYIICLNGVVDEATLMRRAMVKPGTYAGDLLMNLHDAIFRRSFELKREYAEYYAVEYATFDEFVRKRLLLSQEVIGKLSAEFARSSRVIYFNSCYCFLEEDYGREFLEKLLVPKRRK